MGNLTDLKAALAIVSGNDVVDIKLDSVDYNVNANELRQALNVTAYVVMYATDDLHIRQEAGLSFPVLGTILKGHSILADQGSLTTVDNIPWYKVHYQGITGYSDVQFLTGTAPNPVVSVNHKIGFMVLHTTGSKRQALIDSAQRLYKIGKPYTFMNVLDDVDLANQLVKYVPNVVLRCYVPDQNGNDQNPKYSMGSAYETGFTFAILNRNRWFGLNNKVKVQLINEPGFNEYDADFFYGIMKGLESTGYLGCLFNDGVGTPEVDQMVIRANTIVAPGQTLFQYMKAKGHTIGIHCYGEPGLYPGDPTPSNVQYFGQRFKELFDHLDTPDIFITETGLYTAMYGGVQPTVDGILQYNHAIANEKPKAFAWWCYDDNAGSWAKSDFSNALANIESAVSKL